MSESDNKTLPQLITLAEASQLLKCHPNTLRLWDKQGVLKSIRLGNRGVRRYKREDIISLINGKQSNISANYLQSESLSDLDYIQSYILENLPDAILITTPDRIVMEWNKAAEQLFKYTREEVIGKYFPTTIHSPMTQEERNQIYKMIQNARHWTGELVFNDKDNKPLNLLATTTEICNSNGTRIGYLTVYKDITRIREVEKSLEESEIRFRTSFEQAAVGMSHVDFNGTFILVNQKLADILGYSKEELIGKTFQEISYYEDLPQDLKLSKQLREGQIDSFSLEKRYIKKDGSLIWVNLTSTVVTDSKSKPLYYVAVIEDISDKKRVKDELQKNQAQLEGVFESIRDGIVVTDMEGNFLLANKAQATVNHFKSLEDMYFKLSDYENLYTFWTLDGNEVPIEEWPLPRILRGETLQNWELKARRNDIGKEWIFSLSGEPIYDNGKQVMAVIVTRDITEQKRIEQQKDDFIAVASHELKTPLTSIKAYTQMLDKLIKEGGNEKKMHIIERTNVSINRLDHLISDLLDVTKIQAGKLELNKEKTSAYDFVKDVVDGVNLTSTHDIVLNGNCSCTVDIDKARLEQVIQNLLNNAQKYSPDAKEVMVDVSENMRNVIISIKDFGVGIKKESQPYLFDRFYRVEKTSKQFSGLGLGLFIANELVRRHGGEIKVVSEEGEGSTFTVELPICE